MIRNTISLMLLIALAFLSLKHGWDAFQPATAEQAKIMANLGITQSIMPYFGVFSIIIGLMLFFPQTFFASNVLHAVIVVMIIVLSLRAGDYRMAMIEIPFLALPLIMLWLKYPFKN